MLVQGEKFLLIKKDDVNNPELRSILNDNVIGTPGESMVYQHCQVNEKLDHIDHPFFVSVGFKKSIFGTCCFCKRDVLTNNHEVRAYYIRYFTFKNEFRANPAANKKDRKETRLKREIKNLLEGEMFAEGTPHLYYAYIDPLNHRSLAKAHEFGFTESGTFNTVFFSRFFPIKSKNVSQVTNEIKPEVRESIRKFYAKHQLLSFENILYRDNYYVFQENGKIVAGMQANPEHWEVYELPGKNGKFLINFISRIPIIKKIFSKNFRFLSLEAPFCLPGYEYALELLIEDVLARHSLNSAIACLDPQSKEYRLMKAVKGGLLRKLSRERTFSVMVKGTDYPTNQLHKMPVYVSAFDAM